MFRCAARRRCGRIALAGAFVLRGRSGFALGQDFLKSLGDFCCCGFTGHKFCVTVPFASALCATSQSLYSVTGPAFMCGVRRPSGFAHACAERGHFRQCASASSCCTLFQRRGKNPRLHARPRGHVLRSPRRSIKFDCIAVRQSPSCRTRNIGSSFAAFFLDGRQDQVLTPNCSAHRHFIFSEKPLQKCSH